MWFWFRCHVSSRSAPGAPNRCLSNALETAPSLTRRALPTHIARPQGSWWPSGQHIAWTIARPECGARFITGPCRLCNGTGQSLLFIKCRSCCGTGQKMVCPNFLSHAVATDEIERGIASKSAGSLFVPFEFAFVVAVLRIATGRGQRGRFQSQHLFDLRGGR
jgi:hypothetical protein